MDAVLTSAACSTLSGRGVLCSPLGILGNTEIAMLLSLVSFFVLAGWAVESDSHP